MILRILLTGLILFLGFRFIYLFENKLPISQKVKHHINYILPVFELLVWIGFIIWAIKLLYESQSYFLLISVGILFLLLIVPFIILMRDFTIGVFLKVQKKVVEGSFIEVDDLKGEIKKAGHLILEIEDKHGNIRSISYSNIRSKVILRSGDNPNLDKLVLLFSFPDNNKLNEITDKLKNLLISTPWVAASKLPIIENVKTENGKFIIKVGVFTVDKRYAENIKSLVEAQFSG